MYGIRTFHSTPGRFSSGVIAKFISYIASYRFFIYGYESIEFCAIRRLYDFEDFSILLSMRGSLFILGKKIADFSLKLCQRVEE